MCPMPDDNDKPGESNKRVHPRVDFFSKVKITVPDNSTAIDVFAGNVSAGGMFLRSNRPLDRGRKVGLEFDLNDVLVKVDEGEVVWNKPFEPISIDGSPSGMGVEFKSLSGDSRQQIESFISEALGDEHRRDQNEQPASRARMKLDIDPPAASAGSDGQVPAAAPDPALSAPPPMEEEKQMAQLSQPPAPRKRAFLFVGFVLLVAVVTFFVLLMIRPFDRTPTAKDAGRQKAAGDDKEVVKAVPSKPPIAPKKETAKAQPPKPEKETAKTQPPKPEKETAKAQPPKPKIDPGTAGAVSVELPVFSESAKGLRMMLRTGVPVEEKHFTLKDPPRLAIDLQGVGFRGHTHSVDSPAPFISRVRVGQREGFTRFVLDFTGKKVPGFKLIKGNEGITVIFEK